MRELTVRIRFTRHCLGNVRDRRYHDGRLSLPRTLGGAVMFFPSWHKRNMRLAAQLLGRHQGEVEKIYWDPAVDGVLRSPDAWHQRWYKGSDGKDRFAVHEAFFPGQVVGINCLVPASIPDDDFLQLLRIAGQYLGISPWNHTEFGHYEVDCILPRRGTATCPRGPVERTMATLGGDGRAVEG